MSCGCADSGLESLLRRSSSSLERFIDDKSACVMFVVGIPGCFCSSPLNRASRVRPSTVEADGGCIGNCCCKAFCDRMAFRGNVGVVWSFPMWSSAGGFMRLKTILDCCGGIDRLRGLVMQCLPRSSLRGKR